MAKQDVVKDEEKPADRTLFKAVTDRVKLEARMIDPLESLAGIQIRDEAKVAGSPRPGDMILRYAGDGNRMNWWIVPASVFAARYAEE